MSQASRTYRMRPCAPANTCVRPLSQLDSRDQPQVYGMQASRSTASLRFHQAGSMHTRALSLTRFRTCASSSIRAAGTSTTSLAHGQIFKTSTPYLLRAKARIQGTYADRTHVTMLAVSTRAKLRHVRLGLGNMPRSCADVSPRSSTPSAGSTGRGGDTYGQQEAVPISAWPCDGLGTSERTQGHRRASLHSARPSRFPSRRCGSMHAPPASRRWDATLPTPQSCSPESWFVPEPTTSRSAVLCCAILQASRRAGVGVLKAQTHLAMYHCQRETVVRGRSCIRPENGRCARSTERSDPCTQEAEGETAVDGRPAKEHRRPELQDAGRLFGTPAAKTKANEECVEASTTQMTCEGRQAGRRPRRVHCLCEVRRR
ncbi:hypothetical protein OH76DRAFT_283973 [Lentinus brumalis]|uniref:Uncharacterized protein n=1 Tax=Lentinus brumalis TaxID=2498619 RepID=A0A371CKP6_9APHY|nr:hypothetical protein OH76DRAFT_283973 [Polyporus brumalis]